MYQVEPMPRFEEAITSLRENYPRIDAPIASVKKLLALRAGDAFPAVIGKDGWKVFKITAGPGVPSMNVFFIVDDENQCVRLMRVDVCATEE